MSTPYYGILFSNKKEKTIDLHNDLDVPQGNYAEYVKPILKGYILCDSTYTKSLK